MKPCLGPLLPTLLCACLAAPHVNADAARCSQLEGKPLAASVMSLATGGAQIDSAEWHEQAGDGGYCRLRGVIHPVRYTAPDIQFQVNLPEHWNRKTLHFGGGGFNGELVEATGHYTKQPADQLPPLQQGYVTYGSDSGHQSEARFDGRFLLEPEALRNFGHEQLKKVHDLAMWAVTEYYGQSSQYNYFIGGSQGGHEAFDVMQRYPDRYQGVVAAYPAHNLIMLHLSALTYARALRADSGKGWLDPTVARWFVEQVYQRCDELDGLRDGIISDIEHCYDRTADMRQPDDNNPLLCRNIESDNSPCLSDVQLETLNTMNSVYQLPFEVYPDDPDGMAYFPRWTPFEGSTFFDGGFPNLGAAGPEQALQAMPGEATPRYAISGDLAMDIFADFDPRQYAGRIRELAAYYTANSVDLDRFINAGGKLIMFHGTVDDFIPVHSSVDYFKRLSARYDASRLNAAVRFYLIPGMGHVTGPFSARVPTLAALEAWVEKGEAPTTLVAVDASDDQAGRTRPVCEYPGWPRYRGAGDPGAASSFDCVSHSGEGVVAADD